MTGHLPPLYPAGMTACSRLRRYRFWVLYGVAVLILGGVSLTVTWALAGLRLAGLMAVGTVLEGAGFGVLMAVTSWQAARRRARRAQHRAETVPPLDPDWKTPDYPPPSLRLRDF